MSDPADRINLCRCGGDPEPLSDLCRPCSWDVYDEEGDAA